MSRDTTETANAESILNSNDQVDRYGQREADTDEQRSNESRGTSHGPPGARQLRPSPYRLTPGEESEALLVIALLHSQT
jgi:hypothetical protein